MTRLAVDGGLEHLLGGVAARVAQDHGDRAPQDDVDATPDLPAGAVVVDVLSQLVALGENLTDGGRAEGQDGRGLVGLLAFADLGHPVLPSSLVVDASTQLRTPPHSVGARRT